MESYRLLEKNRILAELSSCRTRISRVENQLAELKKSTDKEYISAQTEKNQATMSLLQDKVAEFEQRLVDLAKGVLDEEIMATIQNNTSLVKQKNEKSQKKKAVKAENDAKNAKTAERQHQKNREIDYQNRVTMYEMQRAYERLCDMDFPSYLADNLRDMPNNKGYIWRGVWYMGRLPPENNGVCVMYEKQRGDVMIIHEYTSTEHVIYKKVGKGPKQYMSETARMPPRWRR
jgi:hypothetical protein